MIGLLLNWFERIQSIQLFQLKRHDIKVCYAIDEQLYSARNKAGLNKYCSVKGGVILESFVPHKQ